MTNFLDSAAAYDYMTFVQLAHKLYRNKKLNDDPHLEYCCHVGNEFATGARTRLIINMPPGCGKTVVYSISLTPWLVGHDPTLRIMLVTHDAALAREIMTAIRKIMKSEEYRRIFATRIKPGGDTIEDFQTTAG